MPFVLSIIRYNNHVLLLFLLPWHGIYPNQMEKSQEPRFSQSSLKLKTQFLIYFVKECIKGCFLISPLFFLRGECEFFLILRILILADAPKTDFTACIFVNLTLGY